MPGYQAGVPTGQAPEAIAAGGIAQLASNESPFPPHPKVVEAIARRAAAMNRYPDPDATLLRRRIAERYETEPGRVAVGNGSCEILLAAAEALCEPGAEILYAWPAFSMYPYLAALTGAREIRVPLAEGDVHDLDAMAAEVTAATQLLSSSATRTTRPRPTCRRPRSPPSARRMPAPRHRHPRRGLRRVPDRRRPRRDRRPARRLPQPGRPAHLQQVLRPRRPAGRLRDRLRRASAPRSTPCASRSASTRSPRRPGPRRSSTPTTSAPGREHDRRAPAGRGGAARARPRHRRDAGELLLDRPRRRRRGGGRRRPRRAPDRGPSRHARSATPATSASATAPPRRTTASSPRSAELLD